MTGRLNGGTRLRATFAASSANLRAISATSSTRLVGLRPVIRGLDPLLGEGGRQPRLKFQPSALNVPESVR